MADQSRLPYLNATIQELQRIAVLGPLNIMHTVLEDVQMGKYKIPKGTIVIPQIPSVHLDEENYSGILKSHNFHFLCMFRPRAPHSRASYRWKWSFCKR